MRLRLQSRNRSALTLTEVLFVIVGILFLAALALTLLAKRQVTGSSTLCQNHLKQVVLAFKVWANDNDDRFPYVTTNCLAYTNVTQAWLHFLVMSNELGSPAVLNCPQDTARLTNSVKDFAGPYSLLSKTNSAVSYFVGLEADETLPNTLLSGDRNLLAAPDTANPRVLLMATNTSFRWDTNLHVNRGHVALADGSVLNVDRWKMHALLVPSGVPTNRLLMPLVP